MGAIRMRTTRMAIAAAAMVVSLAPLGASAQTSSAPRYPLAVAVTYNATRASTVPGANFWMQGGSIEIEDRFYRGLGMMAEIAGAHADNIQSSGVGLDLVTAAFGPRYTWALAHRRYRFFAQALVGEADGFNSVFPTPHGAIASSNSLALKMGGGINIALSPHIALRAIEGNWLRTQFPNSAANIQNNLSLGTGFVFRFR